MGKAVFMFPGQGTQTVGMMRELYDEFSVVRDTYQEAEEILDRNLCDLIFHGPAETLDLTVNTQPILVASEIALFRVALQQGLRSDYLVGCSIGEWAAVVAGGVISFADALSLVCVRAEAMQCAVPVGEGGMAVIMGRTREEVFSICNGLNHYASPSNYNYPGQITVSGDIRAIHELEAMGEAGELVVKPLAVSVPSHCELMRPAAEQLSALLGPIRFRDSQCPIVMNATGDAVVDAGTIKRNLIVQLTTAVHFEQSVQTMLECGADTFFELGPGKTLAGFVRKKAKTLSRSVFSSRMDSVREFRAAVAEAESRDKCGKSKLV